MNWIVGTKLSTAKGNATVIDMTDKVAVIQFEDGTTKDIAYTAVKEESMLGSNKVGRVARPRMAKAPKEPKAPKVPKVKAIKQEKEDRKAQKELDKLEAQLAKAKADQERLNALKAS